MLLIVVCVCLLVPVATLTRRSPFEDYDWVEFLREDEVRQVSINLMGAFMNKSVDPCDDFYEYACGSYPFKTSKFQHATKINERITTWLFVSANVSAGNDAERKALDYFNSCLWESPRNDILQRAMSYLDSVLLSFWSGNTFDWIAAEAQMTLFNLSVVFNTDITVEGEIQLKKSRSFVELSLDRSILEYRSHTERELFFLDLKGYDVYKLAEDIHNFKKRFQDFHNGSEGGSNTYTFPELNQFSTTANYSRYITNIFGNEVNRSKVTVFSEELVKSVSKFAGQEDPEQLYQFYRWHVADNLRRDLEWYFKSGRDLTADCYMSTYHKLNSAVLSIFAKRYFKPEIKSEVQNMLKRVRAELRKLLEESDWIDSLTREKALKKADAFTVEIGFSSYIWDSEHLVEEYKDLEISPTDFVMNLFKASSHKLRRRARFTQQISEADKIWSKESALDVDAFVLRQHGGIAFFPIGLFKAPMFHSHFPSFYNYAVLGTIFGHELSHFFDSAGLLFGPEDKLNWFNPNLTEIIKENELCFKEQYNTYQYQNKSIDGSLTVYENIADNNGLNLAFKAYKSWVESQENTTLDQIDMAALGMDPFKAFFISFGQFHCHNDDADDGDLTLEIPEDLFHSPGQIRVIGTMVNSKDFANTFQCRPGTPMNPVKKCVFI